MHKNLGFTLIEVLLALMIIAIGVTALLKAIAFDIRTSSRIQEKTIQHLVAMNAIAELQMNMIPPSESAAITETTLIMGQKWYWKAVFSRTPVKTMQQMTVRVSHVQQGPYTSPVIAYRYTP